MTIQEQKKMWCIESKLVMGDNITEEEKLFYNENLNRMREEMRDIYELMESSYRFIKTRLI